MKNFEIFEVSPNIEKLRQFREEYIRTFEGDMINKIISRSVKWYNYNKGIYSPSTIGLSIKPITTKENSYNLEISDFINYGVTYKKRAKALKLKNNGDIKFYQPVNKYFYLFEEPQKMGITYSTTALEINEDLYNIAMIQFRNFLATTTPEDLSRYSEYFTVDENAIARLQVSEQAIYEFNRCGIISEYDNLELLDTLERTQKAVLSLRK